ncbi:unnamed protein product [Soboliphyme baturini]|uniref:UDP-glucose 4-epimerase n=1 Tax=Soboliphyme baturini TaxID=241478 RepID=A0A183IQL3_9BILA|nr:unnamed protein product [Soboliphyme baturini]
MKQTILLTGGAGYIGSHVAVELLEKGYNLVVVDNFANAVEDVDGNAASLKRVEKITGKKVAFHRGDITVRGDLLPIFEKHHIDCVIHLAGLKAVGESISLPLNYYSCNVMGALTLLQVMKEKNVKNIIYSSSATVYGLAQFLPITESHPVGIGLSNPYGNTKYFIEEILKDLYNAEKGWNMVFLRYFNPVGAHSSGMIGEDPQDIPNNLMPYVSQVAVGKLPFVRVFGNDYDTPDGTGVRDYIHVVDLAIGHVAALDRIFDACGLEIYNLGTGNGVSVLEMIEEFKKQSHKKVITF